jgi:hypothetical protein
VLHTRRENILHIMSLDGDVRAMEALVAHGAAIDFPFLNEEQCANSKHEIPVVAPTDATDLVIICAYFAIFGSLGRHSSPQLKGDLRGKLECAIQLVKLGTDCQRKLNLPTSTCNEIIEVFRSKCFGEKIAKELAAISKHRELIDSMKELHDDEANIENVHCRCGSRLPWKQCHSGDIGERPPCYRSRTDKGKEKYGE